MIPLLCVMVIAGLVSSCSNPSTPAGYVGYVVKQPIAFGHDEFIMTQDGPTSTGLGWRLRVLNVSVTPYTYRESFFEQESILSQDNLKVGFELSVAWRIRRSQVRDFVERFTTLGLGTDPEKLSASRMTITSNNSSGLLPAMRSRDIMASRSRITLTLSIRPLPPG
jgi:hypothetical protein